MSKKLALVTIALLTANLLGLLSVTHTQREHDRRLNAIVRSLKALDAKAIEAAREIRSQSDAIEANSRHTLETRRFLNALQSTGRLPAAAPVRSPSGGLSAGLARDLTAAGIPVSESDAAALLGLLRKAMLGL